MELSNTTVLHQEWSSLTSFRQSEFVIFFKHGALAAILCHYSLIDVCKKGVTFLFLKPFLLYRRVLIPIIIEEIYKLENSSRWVRVPNPERQIVKILVPNYYQFLIFSLSWVLLTMYISIEQLSKVRQQSCQGVEKTHQGVYV